MHKTAASCPAAANVRTRRRHWGMACGRTCGVGSGRLVRAVAPLVQIPRAGRSAACRRRTRRRRAAPAPLGPEARWPLGRRAVSAELPEGSGAEPARRSGDASVEPERRRPAMRAARQPPRSDSGVIRGPQRSRCGSGGLLATTDSDRCQRPLPQSAGPLTGQRPKAPPGIRVLSGAGRRSGTAAGDDSEQAGPKQRRDPRSESAFRHAGTVVIGTAVRHRLGWAPRPAGPAQRDTPPRKARSAQRAWMRDHGGGSVRRRRLQHEGGGRPPWGACRVRDAGF